MRKAYSELPPLGRLAIFVMAYASIAAVIFPHTYYELFVVQYLPHAFRDAPFLFVIMIPIVGITSGAHSPFAFLKQKLAANWLIGIAVIVGFLLFMSAFTTLKFKAVSAFGFYADQPLAELDRFILGLDAWRFTRQVLPNFVIYLIEASYGRMWFTLFLGSLVYVTFFRPKDERSLYLTSLAGVWVVIGTVLAVPLSSAGPVFFDRIHGTNEFSDLTATLRAEYNGMDISYDNYLYYAYASGRAAFGTGISAFPSVHVAVAILNAIFFSRISRVAGAAMWIFACIILLGSMYTGYHYAVDGIASAIIVPLIWIASKRLVGSAEAA